MTSNELIPFNDLVKTVWNSISTRIGNTEEEARLFFGSSWGFGGCNDAFSAFGFLAFLLALLDLIMELQNNDGGDGGRSVRATDDQKNQMNHDATMIAYTLYRGYTNAMATPYTDCLRKFICEAKKSVASHNTVNPVIHIGSLMIEPYANTFISTHGRDPDTSHPGTSCDYFNSCFHQPLFYIDPYVLSNSEY